VVSDCRTRREACQVVRSESAWTAVTGWLRPSMIAARNIACDRIKRILIVQGLPLRPDVRFLQATGSRHRISGLS